MGHAEDFDTDNFDSVSCSECGSGNITREFEYGKIRKMSKAMNVCAVCNNCGEEISEFTDDNRRMRNQTPEWVDTSNDGDSLYYGPNWESTSKRARARDGWECKGCGNDSSDLHVHHITPFKMFIEDGEVDFMEANDFDNLVTLCPRCHKRVEGKYTDLTRDEFVEQVGIGLKK